MSGRGIAALALVGLLLAGCSDPAVVGPERWRAMSQHERTLVVESWLGHQKAMDAKGRQARGSYARTVDFYRAEIDRRYAAGDRRSVEEIWRDLSDERLQARETRPAPASRQPR